MNALLCSDRASPSGFNNSAAMGDRKGGYPINNKVKMTSKITASESFSTDSVSDNFCIDDLLEGAKRDRQFNRIGLSHGLVAPEYSAGYTSEPRGAWIKHLKLAANVHYQNVSIEVAKGRKLRVRVVADVKVSDEIQLWFSPEVLIAMQIPFLTPENIKGEREDFLICSNGSFINQKSFFS